MNPSQTVQQEDKLSVLRKYEKYITKDGEAILFSTKSCRGEEVNCPNLLKNSLSQGPNRSFLYLLLSSGAFEK